MPETETPSETPATNDDEFDKERAMETIRKQRESEAAAKQNAKDTLERAEKAEAELKKLKDASLSEQERIQNQAEETRREAEEAKQANEAAQKQLRDARIAMALTTAATGKVKDPTIVGKLIDSGNVQTDDAGAVTNADALVEELLKSHDYLAVDTKSDDRPTNLTQVLEGGEPVIEDGKPLEGEAAQEMFKRDPDKFHEMMDRGLIKGV